MDERRADWRNSTNRWRKRGYASQDAGQSDSQRSKSRSHNRQKAEGHSRSTRWFGQRKAPPEPRNIRPSWEHVEYSHPPLPQHQRLPAMTDNDHWSTAGQKRPNSQQGPQHRGSSSQVNCRAAADGDRHTLQHKLGNKLAKLADGRRRFWQRDHSLDTAAAAAAAAAAGAASVVAATMTAGLGMMPHDPMVLEALHDVQHSAAMAVNRAAQAVSAATPGWPRPLQRRLPAGGMARRLRGSSPDRYRRPQPQRVINTWRPPPRTRTQHDQHQQQTPVPCRPGDRTSQDHLQQADGNQQQQAAPFAAPPGHEQQPPWQPPLQRHLPLSPIAEPGHVQPPPAAVAVAPAGEGPPQQGQWLQDLAADDEMDLGRYLDELLGLDNLPPELDWDNLPAGDVLDDLELLPEGAGVGRLPGQLLPAVTPCPGSPADDFFHQAYARYLQD